MIRSSVLVACLALLIVDTAYAQDNIKLQAVVMDKGSGTSGNGNQRIDAGERVWLLLYATNQSATPSSAGKLQLTAQGAQLEKSEIDMPALQPKQRERLATRLTVGSSTDSVEIAARLDGSDQAWTLSVVDGGLQVADASSPAADQAQQSARVETTGGLPDAVQVLANQILDALPNKGMADTKIAVAPFVNLGPTAQDKKLGEIVAELLVTRLSERPNLTIIERGQIKAILEELKLSMLGLTEGSNAEKVGKLLGAEAMIVGSVSEVGATFAITARHVDVGTGRVAFAKEVQVPQEDTIALSSKYIVTRSRSDSLFRSLLVPGWGQYYNNDDAKGYVFTGVTLGLIGVGVFQRLQYGKTHDDYMAATSKQDAADLYDTRNSQYNQSNLLFALAGGVWAVNVIDAFLSGTSGAEVQVERPRPVQPKVGALPDGTRFALVEVKL